jgi:hypothetical protein
MGHDLPTAPSHGLGRSRRIGLVGCVKEKATSAQRAKDLYTSTLFVGRRRYVERSCEQWWVLSAAHGLVHPDQLLAPYDVTLKNAGRANRRQWCSWVLAGIDERVRPRPGDVFEIHAGAEYRDFGLVDGLHRSPVLLRRDDVVWLVRHWTVEGGSHFL